MLLTISIPRLFSTVWLEDDHDFTDDVLNATIEINDDETARTAGQRNRFSRAIRKG